MPSITAILLFFLYRIYQHGNKYHMTTYAIILAGGTGTRLGSSEPKQFLELGNRPVIAWSLETFNSHPMVDHIITVIPKAYHEKIAAIIDTYSISRYLKTVNGGNTRQESSWNAVHSVDFAEDDILLLHDAARPFVNSDIIRDCIVTAKKYGSAGTYVPAVDTITEIDENMVNKTLDRNVLYYTQTPQAFRYSIILDAHLKSNDAGRGPATDDVSLVRNAGYQVHAVNGDYSNIKITTEYDYKLAQWFCSQL